MVAAGSLVLLAASKAWVKDAKNASKDEEDLKARSAAILKAFNSGDAKAVAKFWTPDGDYIDDLGHHYKGRKAIAEYFAKMFAAAKGAQLRVHRASRRLIRPDVAVGDGIYEVIPPNGGLPTSARYTTVLVKRKGKWYFECVREAPASAPTRENRLEEFGWLIGQWVDQAKKGALVKIDFSWAENNNFIVSHFITTLQDVPVAGASQWVAWDPAKKKIRSWSFDSTGGFNEAIWTKDGDRLVGKVTTTLRSGKKMTSTNIITIVDTDHITWQSTKRSVDGKSLPDVKPVKLMRIKPE
jgi:uncharacterized protein (TIGR02246 family)